MIYEYNKAVDSGLLKTQIIDAGIATPLTAITFDGLATKTYVEFDGNLTSQEIDSLNVLMANHDPSGVQTVHYVQNKILAAMNFGQMLMVEYGAKNILAGMTNAQVRQVSDKLEVIQRLLSSGSLYCALDEMDNITPDELVTQAVIDEFKGKIQAYLGL